MEVTEGLPFALCSASSFVRDAVYLDEIWSKESVTEVVTMGPQMCQQSQH